jgi:hypothetical protein
VQALTDESEPAGVLFSDFSPEDQLQLQSLALMQVCKPERGPRCALYAELDSGQVTLVLDGTTKGGVNPPSKLKKKKKKSDDKMLYCVSLDALVERDRKVGVGWLVFAVCCCLLLGLFVVGVCFRNRAAQPSVALQKSPKDMSDPNLPVFFSRMIDFLDKHGRRILVFSCARCQIFSRLRTRRRRHFSESRISRAHPGLFVRKKSQFFSSSSSFYSLHLCLAGLTQAVRGAERPREL